MMRPPSAKTAMILVNNWDNPELTMQDIADLAGYSRQSVWLWSKMLDLPPRTFVRHPRKYSDQRRDEIMATIRDMWSDKHTLDEIAEATGVGRDTVTRWAREIGLERKPTKRRAAVASASGPRPDQLTALMAGVRG